MAAEKVGLLGRSTAALKASSSADAWDSSKAVLKVAQMENGWADQ